MAQPISWLRRQSVTRVTLVGNLPLSPIHVLATSRLRLHISAHLDRIHWRNQLVRPGLEVRNRNSFNKASVELNWISY